MRRLVGSISAAALAVALCVSTGMAQSAASEPEQHGHGRHHGKAFKHHGFGLGFSGRHAEALGLTEDQRKRLEEIHVEEREALKALHQQLMDKRRALEDALATDPVNRGTVDLLVQELGTAHENILRKQTDMRIRMLEVLTPDQREQLRTKRDEFRQRRHLRRL